MTKTQFLNVKQLQGVFVASYFANLSGISITQVLLWNCTK